MDEQIIQRLQAAGIDQERLERTLRGVARQAGELVYAFETLTVLEAVLGVMKGETVL